MNQEIANNLSTFRNSIEEFERGYRELARDFEAVTINMNALNSMWTGQSHDALMARFEQDRRTTQEMLDYMRHILEDLYYADTEYRKCENNVARIVDSIRI